MQQCKHGLNGHANAGNSKTSTATQPAKLPPSISSEMYCGKCLYYIASSKQAQPNTLRPSERIAGASPNPTSNKQRSKHAASHRDKSATHCCPYRRYGLCSWLH